MGVTPTTSGVQSEAAPPPQVAIPPQSLPPPSTSAPSAVDITPSVPPLSCPNQIPQIQQHHPVNPQQQHHIHHHQQQSQPVLQHSHPRPLINRARLPYNPYSPHWPPPSSSSTPSSSPLPSMTPVPRGVITVGLPAQQMRPSQQHPAGTLSTFGQRSYDHFGTLTRNTTSAPDALSNPNAQVRQGAQGIQNTGLMSSFGSGSQLRGVSSHYQQRPGQTTLRAHSQANSQSLANQKFQNHGMLRIHSMGTPTSSLNIAQGPQNRSQPWMSSPGRQLTPSALASPSYRPQIRSHGTHQRPLQVQQHQHPMMASSLQQQIVSAQQHQQSQSHQLPEHSAHQYSSRIPSSLPHQQQVSRPSVPLSQKPLPAPVQPVTVTAAPSTPLTSTNISDSGTTILTKRSIQELVSQFDPYESLEAEVEDALVEIAEDFVESITTCGCMLAKHRKSSVLEARDILLNLEKNWNITLPGFSGDEIRGYKRLPTSDAHRERLVMIRKSNIGTEGMMLKNASGQGTVNGKANIAKAPATGIEKT